MGPVTTKASSTKLPWGRPLTRADDDTVLQPDLLVARRSDLTERDLPTAPVLAVEVLSQSTARIDRTVKKARLEVAGCDSYWVVDPAGPSLTAWDLVDGAYVEQASVTGEEAYEARLPFAVQVTPTKLAGGQAWAQR